MVTQASQPFGDYRELAEQSMSAWKSLWAQAMESMPAVDTATGAESASAVMERMLGGLKDYCAWLETMGAASAAAPDGLRWDQAFSRVFAGNPGEPFMRAFREVPDAGMANPGQWMESFRQFAAPMQKSLQGLLDLPAFGLGREHQEQAQQLGKAWVEYGEQATRYQNLIAKVGRLASERLQDKLADHDAPGRQIDSLRALYDLWVDAAEDVYAEVALSDEFREIYGAMVNAQMRVRQLVQKQVEQSGSQLGLPTRSEVDSLGRRLQELRRQSGAGAMQAMREELAQLRAELAELRGSQRRSTARASSTGKASGKTVSVTTATKKTTPRKSSAKPQRKQRP